MVDEVLIVSIIVGLILIIVIIWQANSSCDVLVEQLPPQYNIVLPQQQVQEQPQMQPTVMQTPQFILPPDLNSPSQMFNMDGKSVGAAVVSMTDQSSSYNNANNATTELDNDIYLDRLQVKPNKKLTGKTSASSMAKSNMVSDNNFDKKSTFENNPYANANDADEQQLLSIALGGQSISLH